MLLIDGDIIAYRSCFANKETDDFQDVANSIDDLMTLILNANLFYHNPENYQVYLTGKGNFRYDIDPEYKANRKGTSKPEFLTEALGYLIEEYKAEVSYGEEADDLIAIEACRLGYEATIASIDKDFLQVAGRHYNFYHYKRSEVTEGEGIRNFCMQLLTGDSADNIKGISGIGPKKAAKCLEGAEGWSEHLRRCISLYKGNGLSRNDLEQNGQLLWLRRYPGELWDSRNYMEKS